MPDGFFSSTSLIVKEPLRLQPQCGACKLYANGCKSPKMPIDGEGKRKILIIGESPGCISGDSLVEIAYRDKSKYPNGIPIKELIGKSGFYVYSFSTDEQELVLGQVSKVWKTGRKKVYRVTYEWAFADGKVKKILRNSIVVTSNHLFLMKRHIAHDPFMGIKDNRDYISIDTGLSAGHSLQPFHRYNREYSRVGAFAKTVDQEARLLLEWKIGRELEEGEECHHKDENKLNDQWDNLDLQTTESHARLHTMKINPMDRPGVREKHREVMSSPEFRSKLSKILKDKFKDPEIYKARVAQIQKQRKATSDTLKEKYKQPEFYYKYLLARKKAFGLTDLQVELRFKKRFPDEEIPEVDNHKVISIEYLGVQDVYDMEVKEYHNFAVHGIFVHNSTEDDEGKPFVGPAGQRLQLALAKAGIDLREDCWITNSIICAPGKEAPTPRQIEYCRPNLMKAIRDLQPDIIIPLGTPAVQSMLGGIWREDAGTISKWAGWCVPCQKPNAWIAPTFHPSYCLRAEDPVVDLFFDRHLKAASKLSGKPWDVVPDYVKEIRREHHIGIAAGLIQCFIKEGKPVAWDIETTTLKPDSEAAEIVCCSISDGETTIAYPWHGDAITATLELLKSDVPKIGYNCFSGDTKFLTREYGMVTLREMSGKFVTVLNHKQKWVAAEINSYGEQETVETSFARRNFMVTVRSTSGHEWISDEDGSRITTEKLKKLRYGGGNWGADRVPYLTAPKQVTDEACYQAGIRHGVVLGDGTRAKQKKSLFFQLRLCGAKKELLPYFNEYTRSYPPSFNGDPMVYLSNQMVNLKDPPSNEASDSYLIGFLRGLLATDGCVNHASQISITNSKEVLDWCEKMLPRVGYLFQGRHDYKKYIGRYEGGYNDDGESETIYFSRESIQEEDLLRTHHRKKWKYVELGPFKFSGRGDRRVEEVFCANVPDGHSFTLEGGLVTGNCKFESRWLRAKHKTRVNNWIWDGMQAAHVLDNRPGVSGLKFQAFALLGQASYDSHIKPYLESKDGRSNTSNRVREVDLDALLLYCGLDSILEYKVAEIQMKQVGVKL